jgi:hypothetical protein
MLVRTIILRGVFIILQMHCDYSFNVWRIECSEGSKGPVLSTVGAYVYDLYELAKHSLNQSRRRPEKTSNRFKIQYDNSRPAAVLYTCDYILIRLFHLMKFYCLPRHQHSLHPRPRSTRTGYWAVPTATAGIAILTITTYK